MAFAGLGVCVLFVLAWTSTDPEVAHTFDILHWALAYAAAAVVAWLGVLDASEANRAARRWFAIGLALTAVGDLIYTYSSSRSLRSPSSAMPSS
jgi:hypothetical protein